MSLSFQTDAAIPSRLYPVRLLSMMLTNLLHFQRHHLSNCTSLLLLSCSLLCSFACLVLAACPHALLCCNFVFIFSCTHQLHIHLLFSFLSPGQLLPSLLLLKAPCCCLLSTSSELVNIVQKKRRGVESLAGVKRRAAGHG